MDKIIKNKGFFDAEKNIGEMLSLIHSEERVNQNEMGKMRRAGKKEFIIDDKTIIARSKREALKIYKSQS